MSNLKPISPMLDGFVTGHAISEHHGISCYPAMKSDADDKYIVKTICIPASQAQLDALLLSGAYSCPQDAQAYFHEIAQDLLKETELLEMLSRNHRFLPFTDAQLVPTEDGTGFVLYLLANYHTSLEKYLSKTPLTHLAAVNLGIDICAGLEACREAGYVYIDLKPSNIYRLDLQDFRIGDIGFMAMDSMVCSSLPPRCISPYSPPEMVDAFDSVGETVDTYALGLILYQIYNEGQLPFQGVRTSIEDLMPPLHADYEMAAIILKACAVDPQERWATPAEMGQALIEYMQRNEVNDIPIVQPVISDPGFVDHIPSEHLMSDEEELPPEAEIEELPESNQEEVAPDPQESVEPEIEESADTSDEDESPEEETQDAWIARVDELLGDDGESEEDFQQLSIAAVLAQTSDAADTDVSSAVVTDEVADMLDMADSLIAHEAPAPVVAPEPIEIPIPEPIVLPVETPEESPEEQPQQADDEQPDDNTLPEETADIPAAEEAEQPEESDAIPIVPPKKKKKTGRVLAILLLIVLLFGCTAYGLNYYYKNIYIQEVFNLSVSGAENYLDVFVDCEADETLLLLTCTNNAGEVITAPVVNGQARFDDLDPETQYTIRLSISGRHKLVGETVRFYGSPAQTKIINFSWIVGAEDGSVILNFTVNGPDSKAWQIEYSAIDEPAAIVNCTSHMATISGLTVGKEYTFRIVADDDIYLVGQTEYVYTAEKVAYAEQLTVSGYKDGTVELTWLPTEGTSPESWTVHCVPKSDGATGVGGDITVTVTGNSASIPGLDPAYAYTIEVTAAGMTQSTSTEISANPIVIQDFVVSAEELMELLITWSYSGEAPQEGWLLIYSINDSTAQNVLRCPDASATIAPAVPGATYHITVHRADGGTMFGGSYETTAPEIKNFEGFGVHVSQLQISSIFTPVSEEWTYLDVTDADYSSTFGPEQGASCLLLINGTYEESESSLLISLLTKDAAGNVYSKQEYDTRWVDLWDSGFGRIDIPELPPQAGDYTVEIYFNRMFAGSIAITVTE